mmetsp:Transcript_28957/g.46732  ORF Transcript_28957/g.46732 Transcript_28957/m.46732 type:complete len:213 (+) Transcript_28957:1734-2372(+)
MSVHPKSRVKCCNNESEKAPRHRIVSMPIGISVRCSDRLVNEVVCLRSTMRFNPSSEISFARKSNTSFRNLVAPGKLNRRWTPSSLKALYPRLNVQDVKVGREYTFTRSRTPSSRSSLSRKQILNTASLRISRQAANSLAPLSLMPFPVKSRCNSVNELHCVKDDTNVHPSSPILWLGKCSIRVASDALCASVCKACKLDASSLSLVNALSR